MNLVDLINSFLHQIHPFENLSSSILFLSFIIGTFVQISPLHLNPWDFILGWMGERFNSGMNKKIDKLDKRVDQMEENLNKHIKDNEINGLKNQRRYIINFVNEGINGARHSKESFEDAIKACDAYEEYVQKNDIHNGVINSSIAAIRKKYEEHLLNGDFPTDGYYSAQDVD